MAEDYSKYKPNSNKYKQEQAEKEKAKPKTKQVAKAKNVDSHKEDKVAIVKERASNAGIAVLKHVIEPTAKKLLFDVGSNWLKAMLYPNEQPSTGRRYSNYDRPSYRDTDSRVVNVNERRRVRERIVLESEEDAESVIDAMGDLIETYGQASIADLYDLVGKTAEYTDNRYGWKSVRNFGIRVSRYGDAVLELPSAVLID